MPVKRFLKGVKEIEERHDKRREESTAHSPASHDESNWLISYADMMTLLCAFFIMLFSMAKLDDTKYEKAKEALSKQFNGKYEKPPAVELAREISTLIDELGIQKDAVVKAEPGSVSVAFRSTVFFETASADVRPQGQNVLGKLIEGVQKNEKRPGGKPYRVVIEGHTDSRPVTSGDFPSNWELSGARASRVVRMFLEKGFDSTRLTAIAFADTRPVAPSKGADGSWDETNLAKNRRVVIRVLDPGTETVSIAEPVTDTSAQKVAAPAKPVTPEPVREPAATASSRPSTQPSTQPSAIPTSKPSAAPAAPSLPTASPSPLR